MKLLEILERADLSVVRSINYLQTKKNKVIPICNEEGRQLIVIAQKNNVDKDFYTFLHEGNIEWISIENDEFEELSYWLYINMKNEFFDEILKKAIEVKVSDIHFEPNFKDVKIRFRIHGELILVTKITLDEYEKLLRRIKLESKLNPYEDRKSEDGKLRKVIGEKSYDCRVSTMPVVNGEKLVLRILYSENKIDLEELGFTKEDLIQIHKMIEINSGIILITGPTGSGKSTTINAILSKLNTGSLNIITIEDPVEIYQEGLNQVSVNRGVGLDFATCLRGTLRQDPDIISVGEIRDEETAKIAIRASLSSHKIYTTLHTKDANESFLRLEEMGIDKNNIINSIGGVISQRLVKLLCPNCKIKVERNNSSITTYRKSGCIKCNNTGYKGRKVISACYFIDDKKRKTIRNKTNNEILTNSPMIKSIKLLLKNGEIQYEDYISFIKGEGLNVDINI